jgi:TM2 domain-containing membrane protein YozV
MSADPQQPTEPLPPSPNAASPETGRPQPPTWPQQHARPQSSPEQPTVSGQHTSSQQSAWTQQPPAWAQQLPAAPPPSAWAQQPPAAPYTAPPPAAWPPPPAPGQGMPGHGQYGHERYQIREQPPPQYREQYEPGQQIQEWAPLPLYGQEMHAMTVAPKSPAVSVLLSVFIPGLGSMVNDNVGVGVAILVLNIIGWILAILLIGVPLVIGTWIWGLVDAYQSAQRWNRAHGIIS